MRHNIIRRIFLICSICLSFNVLSWSIGAYPFPITVTQPDGTKITVKLHGDEWYNWTSSTDGYRLVKNNKGIYEYAQLKSGSLVPSGVKATNAELRTSTEAVFVKSLSKSLSASELQEASIRRSTARQAIQKAQQELKDLQDYADVWQMLTEFNIVQFQCSDSIHVQKFHSIQNIIRNFVDETSVPKVEDFKWLTQQMLKWDNPIHLNDAVIENISQNCILSLTK